MGASDMLDGELEGPQTPLAPGASDPEISALLDKLSDMFMEPIFPPSNHVTYNITLLDPNAQPPKPKHYCFSPKE